MSQEQRSPQQKFERDLSTLQGHLLAARYHKSVRALDFAQVYHPGLRKDGITPNFHHQVKIGFSLYDDRAYIEAAGLSVDDVITAGILHDTYEENQDVLPLVEEKFGHHIANLVYVLSKVRSNLPVPTDTYYEGLLDFPETIIAKLHDRRNNNETMVDLKPEKFAAYYIETMHLLEIAKKGITRYPELEGLIQHSRQQIKAYMRIFHDVMQVAANGNIQPYVEAMEKSGIVIAPKLPVARKDPGVVVPEGPA